jgi:alkylated DNA nucleotide flippase Atl1
MREYGGSVPWWRVIRASGVPADEVGDEQLHRLRSDGVRVTNGRVDLRQVRWHPDET